MTAVAAATTAASALTTVAKFFFKTPLRAALTTGAVVAHSSNARSYAYGSPAMGQLAMYRGGMGMGMGMGYPGIG